MGADDRDETDQRGEGEKCGDDTGSGASADESDSCHAVSFPSDARLCHSLAGTLPGASVTSPASKMTVRSPPERRQSTAKTERPYVDG